MLRRVRCLAVAPALLGAEYPGTSPADRFFLQSEISRLLTEAKASGVRFASVVLHVEGVQVRLRARDELCADLRAAGVSALAKRVARALPPIGSFTALLDLDGRTDVSVCGVDEAIEDRPLDDAEVTP